MNKMGGLQQKDRPFKFITVMRSPGLFRFGGLLPQISELTLENYDDNEDDDDDDNEDYNSYSESDQISRSKPKSPYKPVDYFKKVQSHIKQSQESLAKNRSHFSNRSYGSTPTVSTSASTEMSPISKTSPRLQTINGLKKRVRSLQVIPRSPRINELRSKLRSLEANYRRKNLKSVRKHVKPRTDLNSPVKLSKSDTTNGYSVGQVIHNPKIVPVVPSMTKSGGEISCTNLILNFCALQRIHYGNRTSL